MTRRGRVGFAASIALACSAALPAFAATTTYQAESFDGHTASGHFEVAVGSLSAPRHGPPLDVGATDFTIEMWLRASRADNAASGAHAADDQSWRDGNVVLDRSREAGAGAYGVSVSSGRVAFGTSTSKDVTIVGTANVVDGAWHHVAVEYRRSDGEMMVWVDGSRDAIGWTDPADVSFPDDAYTAETSCGPRCGEDAKLYVGGSKTPGGGAFAGSIDELRFSTVLRYTATFSARRAPFTPDASTAALYHFDGTDVNGGTQRDATGDTDQTLAAGDGVTAIADTPFRAALQRPPAPASPAATQAANVRAPALPVSTAPARSHVNEAAPAPAPSASPTQDDAAILRGLAHGSPLSPASIPPIAIALLGVGVAVFFAARFLRNEHL
jgi:hypothetical protein